MDSEQSQSYPNGKIIEEKFIVNYKDEQYDLTEFIFKHPGGVNTLIGKNHKNIDLSFHAAEHSNAAEYLLKEYKMKLNNNNDDNRNESMEHLVDWSKAMLPQIPRLGKNYHNWVNLPVDRPLRLFDNDFMESMTKTSWYFVPVFWIPVIIFIICNQISTNEMTFNLLLSNLMIGFVIWTALEYTFHRFLFHIDIEAFPSFKQIHFLLHGMHHKVPFDNNRLVFPPIPATIIMTFVYQPLAYLNNMNLIDYPKLILTGIIIGYFCYDMTHYYLHHGDPKDSYLYKLKRYHYNHHFVNYDKGYGVTNMFWDKVFNTEIILKELKINLKWKF